MKPCCLPHQVGWRTKDTVKHPAKASLREASFMTSLRTALIWLASDLHLVVFCSHGVILGQTLLFWQMRDQHNEKRHFSLNLLECTEVSDDQKQSRDFKTSAVFMFLVMNETNLVSCSTVRVCLVIGIQVLLTKLARENAMRSFHKPWASST